MAWADAAAHLDATWAQDQAFMLCGLPYAEMRSLIPARLDDVADCSRRIAAKVSTLLDFGRPRTADRSARFSLNAAVRRVVGMMRWSIEQQASGCTLALGDDLPDVRGDIGEIEQVLINLTSNALQSIDGRAGGLRIATSFDAASGLLLAVVEDGGCGIAPEHLERLCEAYFTTRQDCGGTGLGLAISASLVQAHHGTLRFESAPGRGTRAFLALPCAAAAAAAPGALAEASRWS
jgi:polar amino acid transport system substrate-binding protein